MPSNSKKINKSQFSRVLNSKILKIVESETLKILESKNLKLSQPISEIGIKSGKPQILRISESKTRNENPDDDNTKDKISGEDNPLD